MFLSNHNILLNVKHWNKIDKIIHVLFINKVLNDNTANSNSKWKL